MMDKIEEQVSELSSGQENREKVKALSAEIVVHGTTEKPYYEIEYFDLSDRQYHTGYSSYDLGNVFRWREECFEIVKEIESDIIGEQVKELKEVAEMYDGLDGGDILREAADTIESLSAKLQATNMENDLIKRESVLKLIEDIKCNPDLPKNYGTLLDIMREVSGIPSVYDSENIIKVNMERSAEDCGGWIPCSERLPGITGKYIVCKKDSIFSFIADFVQGQGANYWCGEFVENIKDIDYWMPLPEPYHEP